MIYYIVRVETNGDESVISTHDTADRAASMWKMYVNNVQNATFRIDTAPSNATVFTTPEPHYGDFTPDEFYRDQRTHDYISVPCNECGCLVMTRDEGKHTEWHNKLLP